MLINSLGGILWLFQMKKRKDIQFGLGFSSNSFAFNAIDAGSFFSLSSMFPISGDPLSSQLRQYSSRIVVLTSVDSVHCIRWRRSLRSTEILLIFRNISYCEKRTKENNRFPHLLVWLCIYSGPGILCDLYRMV